MSADVQREFQQMQDAHAELFLRVSKGMLTIGSEDAFFHTALQDIGKSLGASRTFVFDYIDSLWYEKFVWVNEGVSSAQALLQGVSLDFLFTNTQMWESFLQGYARIVTDFEKEMDVTAHELFRHLAVRSIAIVPLFFGGKLTGFFGAVICSNEGEYGMTQELATQWMGQCSGTLLGLGHLINAAQEHYNMQRILQKEEAAAQSMLDVFPVPFYIVNPKNYKIIFSNKAFRDFVGYKTFGSQHCYEVLHKFDAPCTFCGMDKVFLGSAPFVSTYHNDNFDLDLTVIENCVEWGKLKDAHATTFIDISDSLALEKERVLEREAVKAKARFLANMSHELRTPVNGITGMSQLAERSNTNPAVAGYLEKIKFSSKALLHIINNILDFSKIEAGKMEIESTIFDLKDTFERFSQDFTAEAHVKNLEASVHISESMPHTLRGDPLRLLQIVQNLSNNAIKFTKHGHVSVVITGDYDTKSRLCSLHIEVADTGIGISQKQLGALFDLFYLGDESFSRQYGGTGIGLPVVQGLCSLMGGEISVKSEFGAGATFTCVLPFEVTHEDEEMVLHHLKHEELMAQENGSFSLDGVRVLLAEDNEINVIIALETLQDFGCEVSVATDGIQVLEMVKEEKFDIVLMDLEMPRMSGFEATEKLRENPNYDTLPIIGMSAHTVQDMKTRDIALNSKGMQNYISKPFDPQNLYDIIAQYTSHCNK